MKLFIYLRSVFWSLTALTLLCEGLVSSRWEERNKQLDERENSSRDILNVCLVLDCWFEREGERDREREREREGEREREKERERETERDCLSLKEGRWQSNSLLLSNPSLLHTSLWCSHISSSTLPLKNDVCLQVTMKDRNHRQVTTLASFLFTLLTCTNGKTPVNPLVKIKKCFGNHTWTY